MGVSIPDAIGGSLKMIEATCASTTLAEAVDIQHGLEDYPPLKYEAGQGFIPATKEEVEAQMNPMNSLMGDKVLQHLNLGTVPSVTAEQLDSFLMGKGVLEGMGLIFLVAGMVYQVDPIYLVIHANLETGGGTSNLARGTVPGYEGYHNVYGIKAYDSNPEENGARYAKEQGWSSVSRAIMGGVRYIADTYIHVGQNTLYKMRWNPVNPGVHQYATDIDWANKQATRIATTYLEFFEEVEVSWDLSFYQTE
ncbi:N-acetylglucosaminidase [Mechercharimyces sp. CAU 1602]|uniref:N-acetylglucosaminidase n=1 Tax=Mechercharimyces sp. CAU 1602 TaxID=2973933 RepID=UPI0021611BDF|nr:glucosaminidase domain-containing protein [Mechercharimyces sp. CAU 1602]MCS1350236.1 glucosaminidase domain-containing protein [Mechercharimyces sp. CAU 1602]